MGEPNLSTRDNVLGRRKVVALVGRRVDWRLLRIAERRETMDGHIVLTVGCIGLGTYGGEDHDGEQVERCRDLHFNKILLADEVVWVTSDGQAGEDTRRDIDLAVFLGRPVRRFQGPLTREEARQGDLLGWSLRCNRCGSYGATWKGGERPGFGAIALCPIHLRELNDEYARHAEALKKLREINYEQEDPDVEPNDA